MGSPVNVDQRRRHIAHALWRVVEREGLPAASLRRIAAEAGCTTGALTHHFADRRDLVEYAFGLAIQGCTERIVAAASAGSLLDAVAEALPLDEYRRAEGMVWLASIAAAAHDPELARGLAGRYAAASRLLADAFRPVLTDRGQHLSDDELSLLVDEVVASVDGVAVYALADPDSYPPERQLTMVARILARAGLLPHDQALSRPGR